MADATTKILSVQLDATQAVNGILRLNDAIDANNKQMALNKQAMRDNEAEMKKSGADSAALAKENEKLRQSNVELAAQTKELSSEKRVLQKEVQNEIRLQSQEEGSLKALRAELSNLTKQYDSLSRAERDNENVGGKLKKQINAVTTEIKGAEEGTQRYYRNVGNYQNAIMGALGVNGMFASSLMGLATSAGVMAGGMAALTASVKAFGAAVMSMATNPLFWTIAGVAGAGVTFKWFYDYNEGIAEATRLTREFTGYAGDNLTIMRDKIRATADVMGKEFTDTLKTADALMANFHIDGQQAMDIINKGFAAGADVNGDFLQKAQQLAPTFHDAGIAADEMVAIITQTKSGIFTEQGLEAIKQGSARIREMSKDTRDALEGIGIDVNAMQAKLRDGTMTTFDAIKQVSAQLKTLPDNAQEVGEVMSAVFGRQGKFASQEMIESLATMSTNLDEVTAKTGKYGELLLDQINTEEELNEATAAIFAAASEGWEEMKKQALIYAKKGLVAIVKGMMEVGNWFVKLYNDSAIFRTGVVAVQLAFKNLWAVAKWMFNSVIDGFKAIGRLLGAVVNAFSNAGKAISSFGEGIAKMLEGVVKFDWDMVKEGWNILANGFANAFTDSIAGFTNAIVDSAIEFYDDAYDVGVELGQNVVQGWNDAISGHMDEFRMPAWTGEGGEQQGGNMTAETSAGGNAAAGGKTGSTTSKGGTKKGATAAKGGTSPAEIERERQTKALQELQKKAQELEKKALEEEAKQSIEGIKKKYAAQEAAIRAAYGNLNMLTAEEQKQANEIMLKLIDKNNDEQAAAIQEFYANIRKQREAEAKVYEDQAKALVNASLETSQEGTDEWLKWRLEQLRIAMEAELETASNNSQLRNAIIAKYEQQATQIYAENAQKQLQIQSEKFEAMSSVAGSLSQITEEFADSSKEAAIASKVLATGEVMLAQAVAIANAIKKATTDPTNFTVWQMIGAIASSVTAVTVAMIQAFTSLNNAKFATGGYVQGAGTSTSDSIPVRVSNGESIMNANTTAMFGGLLSSLNQLGGGVPIQVQQTASSVRGEDMLARAFARGVAMLPNPVVSVEDINRGQRQVEVMNERATL